MGSEREKDRERGKEVERKRGREGERERGKEGERERGKECSSIPPSRECSGVLVVHHPSHLTREQIESCFVIVCLSTALR